MLKALVSLKLFYGSRNKSFLKMLITYFVVLGGKKIMVMSHKAALRFTIMFMKSGSSSYSRWYCCGLAPVSNKRPQGRSITGVGRRIRRKRQNSWVDIRRV